MNSAPAENPPAPGSDEALYQAVEQLCIAADVARKMALNAVAQAETQDATEEEIAAFSEETARMLGQILHTTQGHDSMAILSRLMVNIAAAAQQKHLVGAALTFSSVNKSIHLKTFYGPGRNDYSDMTLTLEVAKQLRDGLDQAVDRIEPLRPRIIMPNNGLVD